MNPLQKSGGLSSLCQSVIYLLMFVFYAVVYDLPANAGMAQKLAFLAEHQLMLSVANLLGYVVFGLLLAVLVLALYQRLKDNAPALMQLATLFGVLWVGLVIASGMIANIGLNQVVGLASTEPEQAKAVWLAVNTVVEGLGGGNEIVGGLWVLFLSIAALQSNKLPKALNYLGFVVGCAGILTLYPADIFTELFGLSQILWFFWLGLVLLRKS
ncbi:DUF4386 family protein [Rheinheimera sp.]|uniref:DUF4386 family protein n=1 Tax=Rheinheimera sp. TaxID=1869214 RepID=UPI002FDE1E0A